MVGKAVNIAANGRAGAALAPHFNNPESPLNDITVRVRCFDKEQDVSCVKAVVAAQCSPLFAMLFGGMRESLDSRLVMCEDVTLASTISFLEYLHSGGCSFADVCEMMHLADKYLLPDLLQDWCKAALEEGMESIGGFSKLVVAMAAGNRELVKLCLAHHKAQNFEFEDMLDTTDLLQLPTQHLIPLLRNDGLGKGRLDDQELKLYRRLVKLALEAEQAQPGPSAPFGTKDLLEVIRFTQISAHDLADEIEHSGIVPSATLAGTYELQALVARGAQATIYDEAEEGCVRGRLALALSMAVRLDAGTWFRPRDGRLEQHIAMDMLLEDFEQTVCQDDHPLQRTRIVKLSCLSLLVLLPGKPGSLVADMRVPVLLDWTASLSDADESEQVPWPLDPWMPTIITPTFIQMDTYPSGKLCTIAIANATNVQLSTNHDLVAPSKWSLEELLVWLQDVLRENGKCNPESPSQRVGWELFAQDPTRYTELLTAQLKTFEGFAVGSALPVLPQP